MSKPINVEYHKRGKPGPARKGWKAEGNGRWVYVPDGVPAGLVLYNDCANYEWQVCGTTLTGKCQSKFRAMRHVEKQVALLRKTE